MLSEATKETGAMTFHLQAGLCGGPWKVETGVQGHSQLPSLTQYNKIIIARL